MRCRVSPVEDSRSGVSSISVDQGKLGPPLTPSLSLSPKGFRVVDFLL